MTTTHAAAIAAAEARLAAAKAEVEDLRARLAAEQAAAKAAGEPRDEVEAPRRLTAADGREAARRRHPGRTRSEVAEGTGSGDAQVLSPADQGRAAARARYGKR